MSNECQMSVMGCQTINFLEFRECRGVSQAIFEGVIECRGA